MKSFLNALCFAAVSLCAANAQATTLYSQGSVWAGNGTDVGSGWTSQLDASQTGYVEFDSFKLASASTITGASWYGIYTNLQITNAAPNTDTWQLAVYSDSNGAPGSELVQLSIPAADITVQQLGTGLYGPSSVDVYEFTASFAGLDAAANTTYWVSPVSTATNFSPLFLWIAGTGNDGASYQADVLGGTPVQGSGPRADDRAFSLTGDVDTQDVPEPSTWLLLGSGMMMLTMLKVRRAQQ